MVSQFEFVSGHDLLYRSKYAIALLNVMEHVDAQLLETLTKSTCQPVT